MDLENKEKTIEWYDNPGIVTSMIIALITVIIILSQSFAINNGLSSRDILRSLLNHNSIYLIVLVYFVSLKTHTGKKNFNFLNLFLILLYFITSITSLLTVFQSFYLSSLVSFAIHIVIFIYLVHTFLKDTRFWKDFSINRSPFNEITNDFYFYTIVVLSIVLLVVNLIVADTFDGIVMSLLECIYVVLLGRYIFLYNDFLNYKKTLKEKKKSKVKKEVGDK